MEPKPTIKKSAIAPKISSDEMDFSLNRTTNDLNMVIATPSLRRLICKNERSIGNYNYIAEKLL